MFRKIHKIHLKTPAMETTLSKDGSKNTHILSPLLCGTTTISWRPEGVTQTSTFVSFSVNITVRVGVKVSKGWEASTHNYRGVIM